MTHSSEQHATPTSLLDEYDRLFGQLDGLPDVVKTGQSTARVVPPLGVGGVKTFIIQTVRHKAENSPTSGDNIFLEYMDGRTSLRLIIPPAVADIIARHRDQLTAKSRSKAAKRVAEERKARGEVPGFMRKKKAR